jgi:integrase
MLAYHACLRGEQPAQVAGMAARNGRGTINAAVTQYFESNAFMQFGESTRALRRSVLKKFCKLVGDKPLALPDRKYLERLLQNMSTPVVARTCLLAIRPLLQWSMTAQLIAADPTAGIKIKLPQTDGFITWNEEQIAQFEARWPIGAKERLALALLVHTGQRRADVIRMGRQHVHDGVLKIKQSKRTRAGQMTVEIPMHPELKAAINARLSEHLMLLVTATGRPFDERNFNAFFREACNDAGLPTSCVPHGLRKACCRRLAEQGCTPAQIAAISGHLTLKEITRYTAAYDRKRAAQDAGAKLIGARA